MLRARCLNSVFWACFLGNIISCNAVDDQTSSDSATEEDSSTESGNDIPTDDTDSASEDAATTDDSETNSESETETDTYKLNCYSPQLNLYIAYDDGAVGCPCDAETDKDICAWDVGLVCQNGQWLAVEDGPCMPQQVDCFSPYYPHGVEQVSVGCACDSAVDKGICNGYAFICMDNVWVTVMDGPCGIE